MPCLVGDTSVLGYLAHVIWVKVHVEEGKAIDRDMVAEHKCMGGEDGLDWALAVFQTTEGVDYGSPVHCLPKTLHG